MQNYLFSLLLFVLFAPVSFTIAQTVRSPYPIIFVHGINSEYKTWEKDGDFNDILDYLRGAGLKDGGHLNVCLDYKRDDQTLSNTKGEDVHLFTKNPPKADFYTINFNVHATELVPVDEGWVGLGVPKITQDISVTATEFTVTHADQFITGDIIRINNEIMEITDKTNDLLQVNRHILNTIPKSYFIGSFGLDAPPIWNLSDESNQASIVKQGYGLKLAIDSIKAKTGATKVILVCHSMGGLAGREFIRSYYTNDVAKIVTIGTPHFGTDAGDLPTEIIGVDNRCDALRDMNDDVSKDEAVFLFGDYESDIPDKYYSKDINADGDDDDIIIGLNNKIINPLPTNIARTWIVSSLFEYALNPPPNDIVDLPGDGVVLKESQYIYYADTIKTHGSHLAETNNYYALIRGLDEPNEKKYAYTILENDRLAGFITYRGQYDALDIDLFKVQINNKSTLKINIEANSSTGIFIFKLLDSNLNGIANETDINKSIEINIPPGTYYIELRGTATSTSYQFPYKLITKTTPIPLPSLEASPEENLNFYDVVINNTKDKIIHLQNNSPSFIFISAFNLSNPSQFEVLNQLPINIPSGQSIDIAVRFKPLSTAEKTGILTIVNNSLDVPNLGISLVGTGVSSATKTLVFDPDVSYNFGNIDISENENKEFNLQNIGSDDVTISEISLTGLNQNQYSITTPLSIPFNLTSGELKTFTVKFQPTSIGTKQAGLKIVNNSDNGSPNHIINLYGNGLDNVYIGGSSFITAYEYWFDDNYTGKVSQITLPKSTLQVNKLVNTNSLNIGLHIMHIRFKDDKALWSSVTSQHFYKFPASNFIDNKIVNYEYWFDNDYTGKVIQNVSPLNPLQLLSDINVNSLNTGLHIFHSRFKDARSQWSSVVSQHFYKLPTSSFVDNKIVEYEYWYDNDYANKVSTNESPQTTLQLISDMKTSTLAQGLHIFHTRFKDANSLWSSVVSQHFYKSKSNLAFPNFVNGFRYWIDLDTSKVTSVSIPVTTNPRYVLTDLNLANLDTGAHLITLQFRDLNGLYSHVISDTFYQLGKPRLDRISPNIGGNLGTVTVSIFGNGFYQGTTVKLKRTTFSDIPSIDSLTYIYKGKTLQVTFDLHNKEIGDYDVEVTVPGDTIMKLINGFKIIEGTLPKPYVNLVGNNRIRPNQWQYYTLAYGNESNIDAVGVPIWLAVSKDAELEIIGKYYIPEDSIVDFSNLPKSFEVDSVLGEAFKAKVFSFYIPRINPMQTGTIQFRIRVMNNTSTRIVSWVNPPLYGSPLNALFGECAGNFLWQGVGSAFKKIPGFSCAFSVYDLAYKTYTNNWKNPANPAESQIENFAWSFLKAGVNCGTLLAPEVAVFQAIGSILTVRTFFNNIQTCVNPLSDNSKNDSKVNTVNSYDPNNKMGPMGIGIPNFFSESIPYPYIIHFENRANATASVQSIKIVDTLDLNIFDHKTLELGFITLGDTVIYLLPNLNNYLEYLDLRPMKNVVVKISAGIDTISGILTWQFESMDPITLMPISNPIDGFLPPNHTAPEGEGSVFFSIRLKNSLVNKSEVTNKACIYFDNNEAICTNTWKNTIDNINPHSKVNTLPVFINDTTFKVSWSGIDTSSGVQEYSVFYSTNGGPYLPWIINTTDTCKTFYGTLNSVYRFYSIAKDSVGNIEQKSIFPDAITTITCQKPTITCPSNIQALSSGDGCGAIVNFSFGVSNFCLEQTISKISGLPSGSYFPIGITMNTFKVTDNFNNTATCSFTVTVSEKIAPIIKCPYSLLRKNDIGKCGANINFTATATDNCDLQPIISYNYPSGSFFSTGVTKVTATATDKSGNSSSCYFNITVSDTQRPNIICPVYQVRYTENGLCKYSVKSNELDPLVSDNCGILAKNYTLSGATLGNGLSTLNNILLNQGLTTINWTASDINDKTKLNSNLSSCSFSILVKDSVPPKLICPVDVQFTTPPGQCTVGFNATPLGIPSGITDNCAVQYPVINNDPKIYPVGLTNVIWTASDISGNKRTCTQKVTVIPYLCNAPTIVTTTDITKNAARIKWQASACSSEYQVSIRQEITNGVWGTWSNWISNNGPGLSHLFTGLTANKYYNFQLRSRCGTVYSTIVNGKFWTKVNSSSPELKTRNSEEKDDNPGYQPNITVIPNPASNYATVSIEGYDKTEKKIIMSTLFGHQVFEAQLDEKTNNLELDLNILHATTGIYMIRVTNSKQHNTVQLIVVH